MLFYISLNISWINLLFKYLLIIIYLINHSVILKIYTVRSLVGELNNLGRSKV